MMEELKPCPFCGGEAEVKKIPLWNGNHGYKGCYEFVVVCKKCGCKADHIKNDSIYRSEEEAQKNVIKVWNRRTLRVQDVPDTNVGDTISRQAAIDIVHRYEERLNGYIGTPDDSEAYAFARGLILSVKRNMCAMPSVTAAKAVPNIPAMLPVYAVSVDDVIENMESELELRNKVLDELDIVGTEREIHSRVAEMLREQIEFVKGLPQVEPEPRKGKWIWDANNRCHCSECNYYRQLQIPEPDNYCPKCGAKMEGEEDE